jgi:hypothetical protein
MAGDWIKVEKATPLKPEVLAISEALQIHPTHAFGLCVRFWMWCDDQLRDGNARSVTKVTLDFAIGHQGMTDALIKVGWLRDRSGSLEVPHFDRHLSEGSKTRALTKERVRKAKGKSNAPGVSGVTQAALQEKRREDTEDREKSACAGEGSNGQAPEAPPPADQTPTLAEVLEAAKLASIPADHATQFFNACEARPFAPSGGWTTRDGQPMNMARWRNAMAAYSASMTRTTSARPAGSGGRRAAPSKFDDEF